MPQIIPLLTLTLVRTLYEESTPLGTTYLLFFLVAIIEQPNALEIEHESINPGSASYIVGVANLTSFICYIFYDFRLHFD